MAPAYRLNGHMESKRRESVTPAVIEESNPVFRLRSQHRYRRKQFDLPCSLESLNGHSVIPDGILRIARFHRDEATNPIGTPADRWTTPGECRICDEDIRKATGKDVVSI